MADNRAADVIAATGGEEALGTGLVARLHKEVLEMNMEGVGKCDCNGGDGIRIGAKEVSNVAKPTIVFVVNCEYKLLNNLGRLENVAVVFGAGADALCLAVVCKLSDIGNHFLDGITVRVGMLILGKTVANVKANYLCAKRLGNVNISLDRNIMRYFVVYIVKE